MVKATFLMVESTCFVVKSPFLHRQTHLFCGNPGPTFARRSLGSGMVDRDCRLASPGDMDPRLRESGGFLRCFFCEERASLTIEKKTKHVFIMGNVYFTIEDYDFTMGKWCFCHGKHMFWPWEIVIWPWEKVFWPWKIVILTWEKFDFAVGNCVVILPWFDHGK